MYLLGNKEKTIERAISRRAPGRDNRAMKRFILYGTSGCHLCEIAHRMVSEALAARAAVACDDVDIADDDGLFERYGLRIPVLIHPAGTELGWPFDAGQLDAFLAS